MRASRSRWIVPLGRRISVDLRWWVLAFAMAAVAVRLGIWQLSRLAARREFNSHLRTRLDSGVVRPESLPSDTARAQGIGLLFWMSGLWLVALRSAARAARPS